MRTPIPSLRSPWLRAAHALFGTGTVGLALILGSGCQSIRTGAGDASSGSKNTATTGDLVSSSPSKTEFRKDLSAEQAFNVHLDLGKVYETQSNFESAIAEYQKSVDLGEKRGNALSGSKLGPAQRALAERRIAGALDRLGRFTQSEAHYRKALELAPKDAKVWNDVGYSYYLQNRLADAERALKTAETFNPGDNRILTNLGLTLAAAGRNDEALEVLSRAGGPAIGQANLGFILAAQGKPDEARTHYQMALTLQPELAAAKNALTQLDLQASKAQQTAIAARPPVTERSQPERLAAASSSDLPVSALPALPPATQPSTTRVGNPTPVAVRESARDPKVAPVRSAPPAVVPADTPTLTPRGTPAATSAPSRPTSPTSTTRAAIAPKRATSPETGVQTRTSGTAQTRPRSTEKPSLADSSLEDLPVLPEEILHPQKPVSTTVAEKVYRDPLLQRASAEAQAAVPPVNRPVAGVKSSSGVGSAAHWGTPAVSTPTTAKSTKPTRSVPPNPMPPTPW
ncbi:MAG: tetratricopeptide repeat protein [Isosphaeraceae bacterium]